MDNDKQDDSSSGDSQPSEPAPLNHTPQNSYGSKQPFKLASGSRPVLIVFFILLAIVSVVLGFLIIFQTLN